MKCLLPKSHSIWEDNLSRMDTLRLNIGADFSTEPEMDSVI